MDRIIILYYSGVGNTKNIALHMKNYLKINNSVDLYSIEENLEKLNFDKYSKIIIGFPTIHSAPASLMMDYIQKLDVVSRKIPAFIYTTYGLYSTNAVRIFCRAAIDKNIMPVYTGSYQCPAADGILLTPKIKRWYKYEKGLSLKIKKDLEQFLNIDKANSKLPMIKWYSAINYPNKVLGHFIKFKIYLHKEKCVRCGLCIKECPAKAYIKDKKERPLVNAKKCKNCYRCIHHCPQRALSLSKKRIPKKTLLPLRNIFIDPSEKGNIQIEDSCVTSNKES